MVMSPNVTGLPDVKALEILMTCTAKHHCSCRHIDSLLVFLNRTSGPLLRLAWG